MFTVASVDNFDMLQSHAAVYCGNQRRSYHGTAVQIVQPSSMLEVYHNDQMSTTTTILPPSTFSEPDQHVALQTTDSAGTSNAVSKRTFEQSPGNSPHKVGKIGPKRPRTVAVRQLTPSIFRDTNSRTSQLQHNQSLTMKDFEEGKEGDE